MAELIERIEGIFSRAPFMDLLGVRLVDVGEGWVETELDITARLKQQHGFATPACARPWRTTRRDRRPPPR